MLQGQGRFGLPFPSLSRKGKQMEDIEKLQHYEKTRAKTRLPAEIKPCLMNMLNGSSPGLIRQVTNAFIVACELSRVGKTEEKIKQILTKQNINPSKIRGILKSTNKEIYQYGCPKLEELGLCIFDHRFDCWWFEKIPRESQKLWRERDFWRYEYPAKLGTAKSMIYLAIKEIETKRGYQAGSRLYISWDEIQRVSRAGRNTIKPGLETLEKAGLIRYKPGQRRAKGSRGLATEISRVIPIPKP